MGKVTKMRSYNRAIFLLFSFFVLIGFVESFRGPVVPLIRNAFDVNYTQISILIAFSSAGYILMTFMGGFLIDRMGHKIMAIYFLSIMMLSLGGIFLSTGFVSFIVANMFLNTSFAGLALICNTLAPVVFARKQAALTNLLHFFYGLGATLGPRYAGLIMERGFGFRIMYLSTIVFAFSLLIPTLLSRFPTIHRGESSKISILSLLKDRRVILFILVFGFYVSCEMAMGQWLPSYLKGSFGYSEAYSASFLSNFYLIFTLGRLTAGLYIERIGYIKVLISYSVLSILIMVIAYFQGERALFLYSAVGLFFSIFFPTLMVFLFDVFKDNRERIISLVVTIASLISMSNNFIIGLVNDIVNVRVGFSLVIVYLVITFISLMILVKKEIYARYKNKL